MKNKSMTYIDVTLIVCDKCGNKRCPHASDFVYKCTNSNKAGQKGSIFTKKGIIQ